MQSLYEEMDDFVDLSSGLSVDYESLYESRKYTDISIQVGAEQSSSSKIFFAHTLVLCTRSKFLENSLTGNAESPDEIQKTAMTFEDVTPDVFEILLRYIYTGRMSYSVCKNIGWISLIDGAGKFELFNLLTAIETWLIDKQQEWIQQNIFTVHKYAASAPRLNRLLDYCNQIMVSQPEIVFKLNEFKALPKETLITLHKSDDLKSKEECGSARKIEDLNAVTYPPHIKPPDPTLNQDAQPGKYKYQRSFLMQFMTVCKKKPENLSHLDAIGHQQVGGLTIPMEMVAPLGRSDNRLVSQSVPGEVPKAGDHIIELANKSKEECSGRILKTIIQLTFEKACDEPNYSQIYAQLCRKMLERIDMDIFDETIKNAQGECVRGAALFRKYLLTMCQESFEKGWKIPNNEKGMPNRFSDKRRGLGLIRFIGELFKVHMLTERIMHDCIKKLLANREDPEEEEAEFLCELLMIIGKELDYLRAKSQMNAYFIRMDSMSKNTKLSSRIRFMLTDVIELRKRNWIPRHDNDTNAPRTIGDIQPRSGIWGSSSRFGQASGNSTRLSRTSDDRDKVGMQHGMQQMSDWTVGPSSARKVDLTRFGQVRSNKVNLALGNDPIARLASGSEGWRTIKEHNEKGSSMSSTHTYNVLSGYTLKSSSISQEEAKRKIKAMVDEYWSVRDKKEVAVCIKELPDRYFGDAIREFIESALDKKPADVSNCADLLKELRKQDAISPADCKKAFTIIMGNLGDIAVDVPHAYAHTGQLLHGAQLELREVITLVGLLTGIGGSEPPSAKVVAAYLNSIKTSMGELMVLRKVKNANFDFALLFPDGNKDAVNRFLEKQGLEILKK